MLERPTADPTLLEHQQQPRRCSLLIGLMPALRLRIGAVLQGIFLLAAGAYSAAPGRGLDSRERLIGWKGEVHSVVDSLEKPVPVDRRQGNGAHCVGADFGCTLAS